jgi:hypothetical protein
MTDLTPTEVIGWSDQQPVTDDNVLEVVDVLNADESLAATLRRF